MEINISELKASLKEIDKLLTEANEILDENPNLGKNSYDVPEMIAEDRIESSFIKTLVLLDRLNLFRTYDEFIKIYSEAKTKGFLETSWGIDSLYFVWVGKVYTYLMAIGNSFNATDFSTKISTDLINILRSTIYSITDKNIFNLAPKSEKEVHDRIEAVLKCVFPRFKT